MYCILIYIKCVSLIINLQLDESVYVEISSSIALLYTTLTIKPTVTLFGLCLYRCCTAVVALIH